MKVRAIHTTCKETANKLKHFQKTKDSLIDLSGLDYFFWLKTVQAA